ncbi:G/U mismatch-specific DNA glycosylase [Metabacillus iocasae]|uniref:TDG/mug DNA glycosylase family protein n=1 Tax=Priestia iocasae TaxID=2291674 RepID=A0ABS2QW83_9BACI|nr:G/U mismatch-specific DNA glycosylase [Metabacillus iocasae]MBM7703731.1 TDG/mug DNA glycosylase family protein [Metabacillus iocasae]
MNQVKDYMKHDLDILFVGFNPSLVSGETGHHFANPRNRFWTILHRAGITPRRYHPEEDFTLLDLGYGLTNIVTRPTKEAAEITREEYEEGRKTLNEKITFYKPRIVCFVGKGVYLEYSKQKRAPWGVQDTSVVPHVMDFVAPSSSGLVRIKVDKIVHLYSQLPDLVQQMKKKE